MTGLVGHVARLVLISSKGFLGTRVSKQTVSYDEETKNDAWKIRKTPTKRSI